MHELSVAQAILQRVEAEAQAAGLAAVRRIKLEVGSLAGIVPASLSFCFEAAARGTVAEGAGLEIELLASKGRCLEGDHDFAFEGHTFACSLCGSARFRITGGRELFIVELEGDREAEQAVSSTGLGNA